MTTAALVTASASIIGVVVLATIAPAGLIVAAVRTMVDAFRFGQPPGGSRSAVDTEVSLPD